MVNQNIRVVSSVLFLLQRFSHLNSLFLFSIVLFRLLGMWKLWRWCSGTENWTTTRRKCRKHPKSVQFRFRYNLKMAPSNISFRFVMFAVSQLLPYFMRDTCILARCLASSSGLNTIPDMGSLNISPMLWNIHRM